MRKPLGLTVRFLMVTMRFLLVSLWGHLGYNEEPPDERKLWHSPYHEGTSWSHSKVSYGHHEAPLGLTVRFLLVMTRSLLMNIKFDLTPTIREPLGLTVSFLMVTTQLRLILRIAHTRFKESWPRYNTRPPQTCNWLKEGLSSHDGARRCTI